MAGYDQILKVKTSFEKEAKDFIIFLQNVGKKYTRPTKIKYQYLKRGRFSIVVDGRPAGIDALFQELILNRGLYYYSCTLKNKKIIIDNVIIPIYRQLVDNRFENPQSRFLRKHVLGKYSQHDFVPTDAINKSGYDFEILHRKWDLSMISNKEYLISLDALITQFLLEKFKHKEGSRSPKLNSLVDQVAKIFLIDKEVSRTFKKIHEKRTAALHRLDSLKITSQLEEYSGILYNYFHYLDEYIDSQKIKTIILRNKKYKRIKYGDENILDKHGKPYCDENGVPYDMAKIAKEKPCHDCGVLKGEYHVEGCDAEICPKCGGQYISFDCGLPK